MPLCIHLLACLGLQSFDELLLLERGGRMIYAGPLGTQSSHMVAYFEGLPGVPRIQEGFNPSTWMLEISTLTAELRRKQGLADSWSRSHLFGWASTHAGCTVKGAGCPECSCHCPLRCWPQAVH